MTFSFYVLLAITVLINMGGGVIIPIMPLLLKEHGFVPGTLSLAFAALVAARFVSQSACGRLVTRLGAYRVLLGALALYIAIMLSYLAAASRVAFVACRAGEGLFEGAAIVCLNDLVLGLTTPETRGRHMGAFTAAFGLGFIIGPLLGSALHQYGGMSAIFAGTAAVAALGVAALWLQRAALAGLAGQGARARSIRDLNRAFLAYLPYYGPQTYRRVLFFSLQMVLPLYLHDRFSVSIDRVGVYFSLSAVVSTVLMPMGGRLADRVRSSHLLVAACLGVMALSIGAFGLVRSSAAFLILFVGETVAFSIMVPAAMKVFADLVAERRDRSLILGACGSLTELSSLVVPLVVLPLYGLDGRYPWCLLAGLALLVSWPFLRHLQGAPVAEEVT